MTKTNQIHETHHDNDPYPSRGVGKPKFINRKDPVIYSKSADNGPLETNKIESYRKNGFLVLEGFFSQSELNTLQEETYRLRHDKSLLDREETFCEPGADIVRSIFDIHILSDIFAGLALSSRLSDIARFILNDDVYIHQSRLNYKPGFHGKEFYWHSDFETWHMEDGMPRMRALSMSVTLTENNEFNGPLMLIPGSQTTYVSCPGKTPEDHYKQSLKKQEYGVPDNDSLKRLVADGGIKGAKGPAGSLIIFDCNIMHGSNGNISPFPRSNAFFVYNAMSNRLVAPYGGTAPRPGFIAHRTLPTLKTVS